ncbi:hypothetical protein LINPERPRIM_LOCUS8652 [Linum perenne]
MAGEAQALKRIPRIKFPQRHLNRFSGLPAHSVYWSQKFYAFLYQIQKLSDCSASKTEEASNAGTGNSSFFSIANASKSVGGQASLQPKRSPVSNDEIEAILLGGCI